MKLGDIVDIIGTNETGEIIQIAKVSKLVEQPFSGGIRQFRKKPIINTWENYTEYKLKNGETYKVGHLSIKDEIKLNVTLSRDNRLKNLL